MNYFWALLFTTLFVISFEASAIYQTSDGTCYDPDTVVTNGEAKSVPCPSDFYSPDYGYYIAPEPAIFGGPGIENYGGGFRSGDSFDKVKSEGESFLQCSSEPKHLIGNPIVVKTGNKIQIERDFYSHGAFPISITKRYNHFSNAHGLFGTNWISDFDFSLSYVNPSSSCPFNPDTKAFDPLCEEMEEFPIKDGATITLHRPDGSKRVFLPSGTASDYIWEDSQLNVASTISFTNNIFEFYDYRGYLKSMTN